MGICFVAVLLVVAGISFSMLKRQRKAANFQQALSNTRSFSLALLEFDQEFGAYPHEGTKALVEDATGTELGRWRGTSNDCFRQLVAYGFQSEDIFYAIHPQGTHEPDNLIMPMATEALKPGEVGFSFSYGHSSAHHPEIPLLLAPMQSGSHLAWRDTYGGKAVVRLIDTSELPCTINRKGEIIHPDGKLLLDPARPCWKGLHIDIRHPEFP
ncbi:hypothetical protein HAHE_10780 [Haloferula helveola]|uniref:Uncharacterized protein n=2 Tax=Haloferula helveola TaxID=490095 RepID=A0ABN6H0S5_9BACT|nr:hypothetical protein HAHE_10780 [Haloferula helveola]